MICRHFLPGILLLDLFCFSVPVAYAQTCAGEIVRVASGQTVVLDQMAETIRQVRRVALGERHGVTAHPEAAACLLQELGKSDGVTLVLEHLRRDQQSIVDTYRGKHPEIASGLGTALAWWETGWPQWKIYLPLFEAAWGVRAVISAGDRPKDAVQPIFSELRAHIGEDAPHLVALWGAAMGEAHCGLADRTRAQELGEVQVARDQSMAAAVSASTTPVTLLFTGRAHARIDRSVPVHLLLEGKRVVSVSLQETSDANGAVDRNKVLAEAQGRFDYVWFVGETREPGACDKLRNKGLIK